MLPCYKQGSTWTGQLARVDHSYIIFCPVCRHVIIPYISKCSFANVIMPNFYLSIIASSGGASDLSLTSAFPPPPPPQEITAEGRKWKRVSQAGYDWNQSAQWQQHPHETGRQQSVRRLGPITPLHQHHQKNIRIIRPNPRESSTLEISGVKYDFSLYQCPNVRHL